MSSSSTEKSLLIHLAFCIDYPLNPDNRAKIEMHCAGVFAQLALQYKADAARIQSGFTNLIFVQQWVACILVEDPVEKSLFLLGCHIEQDSDESLSNTQTKPNPDNILKYFENSQVEAFLPVHTSAPMTLSRFSSIQRAIRIPNDLSQFFSETSFKFPISVPIKDTYTPDHFIIAIFDDDSTCSFYRFHKGIVPPPLAQTQKDAIKMTQNNNTNGKNSIENNSISKMDIASDDL